MNKFDLNERLVDFAVMAIGIVDVLPSTKAGNHIGGQLVRSGTSPALNYGEAQSGESRKDFIHKLQISLKELRESMNAIKIIRRAKLIKTETLLDVAEAECNELISIFVKSIATAKKNDNENKTL